MYVHNFDNENSHFLENKMKDFVPRFGSHTIYSYRLIKLKMLYE